MRLHSASSATQRAQPEAAMTDTRTLGPWLRRFLAEYLVSERNLARNTQRSYRDTLVLLLPFVGRALRKPVDRLAVLDLTSERVLQFQRRFQQQVQANNLSTFGVSRIPCDSQLRDLIDRHDYSPIMPCFADWIGRMQRLKWLQHYQIFDARYLITLGGSRYFSSDSVRCKHCLTTTSRGITSYHHDILQAAIVHPDKREVLPLAPEFVRNSDAKGGTYNKQDCEINAGNRMLQRLRADYPRINYRRRQSLLQRPRRSAGRCPGDLRPADSRRTHSWCRDVPAGPACRPAPAETAPRRAPVDWR